jgi:hypothetical protein
VDKANKEFGELMKCYAIQSPETISYQFADLATAGVKIVTSADGHLRMYSWDTKNRDRIRRVSHIIQYGGSTKGGAYFFPITYYSGYSNGNYYTNIYDFNVNGHSYYLTIFETSSSKTVIIQGLQVMDIIDNILNDNVPIIKDGDRNTSMLITAYNKSAKHDINPPPSIRFDDSTNTISVPTTNSKFEINGKFITYKFTGQYFEKVSNLAK